MNGSDRIWISAVCLLVALVLSRSGDAQAQAPRRDANRRALESLAERIEPEMRGKTQRLQEYIAFFARELANDPRLFAFAVTAAPQEDGRVRLEGFVEFPETRQALVQFLEVLGFSVDDQLETCPAETLGDRKYGLLTSPHSLSYDHPVEPRSVVTDCLLGEMLYLLREDRGHYLVHSGEGYLGYVQAADIRRMNAAEWDRYQVGPRVRVLSDYAVEGGPLVPKGAQLKVLRNEGPSVTCELPGGQIVSLPGTSCERVTVPTESIDRIIDSARQLVGTRYLWGGKSSKGIDCSGLVQVGFATAGIHLPRDSNQQILMGQLSATRWHRDGLRRGDTLYFVGPQGRIQHTALYLGEDRFLHAVSPVVRINSLNPDHPDYDAARATSFVFAKRLLE